MLQYGNLFTWLESFLTQQDMLALLTQWNQRSRVNVLHSIYAHFKTLDSR